MGTKSDSVGPGTDVRLAEEDRHRILADADRRTVIAVLRGSSRPISLDTLVERVIDRNGGMGKGRKTVSKERVAIGLHHDHLPTLADMGVLSYDPETTSVVTWVDLDSLTD